MTIAERAVRRALERIGSIYHAIHERELIEALEEVMSQTRTQVPKDIEAWNEAEAKRIRAAVEAERAACAKLAEEEPEASPYQRHVAIFTFDEVMGIKRGIATRIRARGEAKP